ncbi:hypothetical protein Vafri_21439, partial [Volvox africanus]
MFGKHRAPAMVVGVPAGAVPAFPENSKKYGAHSLSSSFKRKFLSGIGKLKNLKGGSKDSSKHVIVTKGTNDILGLDEEQELRCALDLSLRPTASGSANTALNILLRHCQLLSSSRRSLGSVPIVSLEGLRRGLQASPHAVLVLQAGEEIPDHDSEPNSIKHCSSELPKAVQQRINSQSAAALLRPQSLGSTRQPSFTRALCKARRQSAEGLNAAGVVASAVRSGSPAAAAAGGSGGSGYTASPLRPATGGVAAGAAAMLTKDAAVSALGVGAAAGSAAIPVREVIGGGGNVVPWLPPAMLSYSLGNMGSAGMVESPAYDVLARGLTGSVTSHAWAVQVAATVTSAAPNGMALGGATQAISVSGPEAVGAASDTATTTAIAASGSGAKAAGPGRDPPARVTIQNVIAAATNGGAGVTLEPCIRNALGAAHPLWLATLPAVSPTRGSGPSGFINALEDVGDGAGGANDTIVGDLEELESEEPTVMGIATAHGVAEMLQPSSQRHPHPHHINLHHHYRSPSLGNTGGLLARELQVRRAGGGGGGVAAASPCASTAGSWPHYLAKGDDMSAGSGTRAGPPAAGSDAGSSGSRAPLGSHGLPSISSFAPSLAAEASPSRCGSATGLQGSDPCMLTISPFGSSLQIGSIAEAARGAGGGGGGGCDGVTANSFVSSHGSAVTTAGCAPPWHGSAVKPLVPGSVAEFPSAGSSSVGPQCADNTVTAFADRSKVTLSFGTPKVAKGRRASVATATASSSSPRAGVIASAISTGATAATASTGSVSGAGETGLEPMYVSAATEAVLGSGHPDQLRSTLYSLLSSHPSLQLILENIIRNAILGRAVEHEQLMACPRIPTDQPTAATPTQQPHSQPQQNQDHQQSSSTPSSNPLDDFLLLRVTACYLDLDHRHGAGEAPSSFAPSSEPQPTPLPALFMTFSRPYTAAAAAARPAGTSLNTAAGIDTSLGHAAKVAAPPPPSQLMAPQPRRVSPSGGASPGRTSFMPFGGGSGGGGGSSSQKMSKSPNLGSLFGSLSKSSWMRTGGSGLAAVTATVSPSQCHSPNLSQQTAANVAAIAAPTTNSAGPTIGLAAHTHHQLSSAAGGMYGHSSLLGRTALELEVHPPSLFSNLTPLAATAAAAGAMGPLPPPSPSAQATALERLCSHIRMEQMLLAHVPLAVTVLALDGRVVYQNGRSVAYMGNAVGMAVAPGLEIGDSDHSLQRIFTYDPPALESMWEAVRSGKTWSGLVCMPPHLDLSQPESAGPMSPLSRPLSATVCDNAWRGTQVGGNGGGAGA